MEANTVNLKNFVIQFQDPVILAQEGHNLNNNSAPDDNPPGESAVSLSMTSQSLIWTQI